ncbi:MAG: AAA family ATPase [Deltaproteobacteria bacterium]|nr:AAA family ATPase [Deltaproteobacteria bacterium]
MLNQFEEQVKQADGQEISFAGILAESVLSENQLKNLDIPAATKYLGPISKGSIGQIFGLRGIGKTFFRDAISICLTRNLNLGPLKTGVPASVLIVDAEMPLDLLKNRQALSQSAPVPLKPMEMISNEYLYQAGHPAINLLNPAWRDAFLELMESNDSWDVIIFDNLSSFMPGSKENDSEAWGPVNEFLLKLRWMGKAVIFVHHAGKSGDQRGTSAREDQLDYVFKLTLPAGYNPEDGCKFDCTLTKARGIYGAEAAPFNFEIVNEHAGMSWTTSSQKENKKNAIITLLGEGLTPAEICSQLKIKKAYVSRTKAWAVSKGYLDKKTSGFTPLGEEVYREKFTVYTP